MSTMVAICYDDEHKADEVRLKLLKLQREYLIDLEDAVVATRKPNGKIKLHQSVSLPTLGAARGGFWGLLIGMIFMTPMVGAAVGAASGAIAGALSDAGISDQFMKDLAERLQPGTSALFVLVKKVTPDKVLPEISEYGGEVLRTSLSHEDETKLQAALDKAGK